MQHPSTFILDVVDRKSTMVGYNHNNVQSRFKVQVQYVPVYGLWIGGSSNLNCQNLKYWLDTTETRHRAIGPNFIIYCTVHLVGLLVRKYRSTVWIHDIFSDKI